jgi:acetyltransferase-like isoleucine patch superfamily enzyme
MTNNAMAGVKLNKNNINHQKKEAQLEAFENMIEGKGIPHRFIPKFILEAIFSPIKAGIIYLPGVGGYGLRRLYYSRRLKHLGKNSLIDVGVIISGEKNVSIGDYVWIDRYCGLEAIKGFIEIGKRVHVGPHNILVGIGGLKIGDYISISGDCKFYTTTHHWGNGKRMAGPMVPMWQQEYKIEPITIESEAFIGAGVVVLPGIKIGEGAVVGANSVVTKDVPPWTVVVGIPAKPIGMRPKVVVPEI